MRLVMPVISGHSALPTLPTFGITFLILLLVFYLLIFGLVLVGLYIVFINFMSGDARYMSWIRPFRMERKFLSGNHVQSE